MYKRKYTKIQMLLPVIEEMIASGMSHREIEMELGLEGDRPIHNLLKRQTGLRSFLSGFTNPLTCMPFLQKKCIP